MSRTPFVLLVVSLAAVACGGDPIGEPCKLAPGALGLGFDDPCATQCLEYKEVDCPDGSKVRKAICAGRAGCEPGSCSEGEVCYTFEDPFELESYCIPADFCGAAPATADAAVAWEKRSRDAADALRAKFAERKARRSTVATKPSTAPEAEPSTAAPAMPPRAAQAPGAALVASWGSELVLVVCERDGAVEIGSACRPHLPPGTELELAGWRLRVAGSKAVTCRASGETVPGLAVDRVAPADDSADRWGWLPEPPSGWSPATPSPLDPVLAEIVSRELAGFPVKARLELAVRVDLDGDPYEERVVRAVFPAPDVDKPPRAILWLVDDDSVVPLPTGGMDLNGLLEVRGVLPLESGGALLVFTSEWLGGSGVHVVGPKEGGIGPLAEAACGS